MIEYTYSSFLEAYIQKRVIDKNFHLSVVGASKTGSAFSIHVTMGGDFISSYPAVIVEPCPPDFPLTAEMKAFMMNHFRNIVAEINANLERVHSSDRHDSVVH